MTYQRGMRRDELGPTEERLNQGGKWVVDEATEETEEGEASVKRMRNLFPDIIAALAAHDIITGEQLDAAREYERLYHACSMRTGQRSCLDFSPVGHEPLEESQADIALSASWRDLCRAIPDKERSLIRRVVIDNAMVWAVDIDTLRSGLDIVREHLGMA